MCLYQQPVSLNSLAPGRFKVNFRWAIYKLILVVNGWGISCETDLIWASLDHAYGKSTLVPVMAWCRQATSHYLNQCWPRSLPPNGVTRPQWVKTNWAIACQMTSLLSFPWRDFISFTAEQSAEGEPQSPFGSRNGSKCPGNSTAPTGVKRATSS